MKVLLLGCGRSRERSIRFDGGWSDFSDDELVAIDIDPESRPDICMDLCELSDGEQLPFLKDSFDEIHAYDVLEHLGRFGDWRGFFTEFKEYHRVLKPGGRFFILVPVGDDALSDPGHSRLFHEAHFAFLSQGFYESGRRITDYRWIWDKSFEIDFLEKRENHHLAVILRKV